MEESFGVFEVISFDGVRDLDWGSFKFWIMGMREGLKYKFLGNDKVYE